MINETSPTPLKSLRYLPKVFSQFIAKHKYRRLPVILQLNDVECGAACLAMILGYYGRPTRIADCRERCGVGRDGATAQAIVSAARQYGLRTKAYSVQDLNQFRHLQLPAIVHWNFNHFVVVERWSPQEVEIVDPAFGRQTVTSDQFATSFTGVALTFEPGVHFEKEKEATQPAWRNYLAYLFRTPGTLTVLGQVLLTSLFLQLLGLALPAFTKVLIDDILALQISHLMLLIGLGLLLLMCTQMIIGYLRAALLVYLQGRLDAQLMSGFFEHVLTLPFSFFQKRSNGDLLMRLNSNRMIRELVTSQTISTLLDGSFVLVYLVILLSLMPLFGVLVFFLGIIQVGLLLGTTGRMHRLMQNDLQADASAQSYMVEALNGIATLKASGAEERTFAHWSNLFFKHLNISLRRNQLTAVLDTAIATVHTFSPLILLWMGALYVLNGSISLGTMLALNVLAIAFLTPLSSLVANGQQFQFVGAHLERIGDVLEAKSEQDAQGVQQAPPLTGYIELQDVSFRYSRNAPLILRDISLTIAPGQKVAIVGATGSGKSTLAKLILALYEPTSGQITFDGIPVSTLDYRTLRQQFGAVLQEPFLFNISIRRNIAFNNPEMPFKQIAQAAHLAAIEEDILDMPMGYETLVAENGAGLSGGQRQRLTLARALAHKPTILLLDEATSHLDVATELILNQRLSDLNCTQIVIAHRLSTIRDADTIVVLEEGKITEQGSHNQLLQLNSAYVSLINNQLEKEQSS